MNKNVIDNNFRLHFSLFRQNPIFAILFYDVTQKNLNGIQLNMNL